MITVIKSIKEKFIKYLRIILGFYNIIIPLDRKAVLN